MLTGSNIELKCSSISPNLELHGLADFFTEDFPLEVGGYRDLLAIHLGDHIAGVEIASLHRSAGLDTTHHHAGLQPLSEAVGLRNFLEAGDRDSKPRTAHIAASEQLLHDVAGLVDGDGKPHAAVIAADESVDADHPPIDIAKRAAAVAGVDRGVGLDELVVIAAETERASLGADDAESEGVWQLERGADRESQFTNLQALAIPQLRDRQISGRDFQDSQVTAFVGPQQLGLEAASIAQFDLNPAGSIDDMVVREDVAFLRKNESRADIRRGVELGIP